MCTVKIQFVLWVATETVRFHGVQMSCFFFFFFFFFLRTACFPHLVGQNEQFVDRNKLSWGCKPPDSWHFCAVFRRSTYSPY